jgi:hypothetical protein
MFTSRTNTVRDGVYSGRIRCAGRQDGPVGSGKQEDADRYDKAGV